MKMYNLTTFWKDKHHKNEFATMGNLLYALSIYYDHPDFVSAVAWVDDENGFEHIVFEIEKED